MPIEATTPFKDSVLTSSPLNTDEAQLANAALLAEITASGPLSTPARNYARCVIRQSEHVHVRNTIIEEEHAKLKAAVTKRKSIISGKRKIIDGKHILTTSEILTGIAEVEKMTKKRKSTMARKGKRVASQVAEESNDESETRMDELLVILEYIGVES